MLIGSIFLLCASLVMLFVIWSAFRRLRRSEAYFRSLFENALELITILDPQGRIVYENPSNEKFVGYARKEMQGKVAFDFFLVLGVFEFDLGCARSLCDQKIAGQRERDDARHDEVDEACVLAFAECPPLRVLDGVEYLGEVSRLGQFGP